MLALVYSLSLSVADLPGVVKFVCADKQVPSVTIQVTISESGHCPLLLSERLGPSTLTGSEISPSTLISLSTSSEIGPPTLSLSVEG